MTGTPVEIREEVTGMTIRKKALLPDSGSAGEYRGGPGQVIEMVNGSGGDLTASSLSGRTQFAASGLAGANPAVCGPV